MDDERINSDVGRTLRARRRLLDMSQKEVAKRCVLTFQQIHKYESGLNRISVAKLVQLSRALDVAPAYFLEGIEAVLERPAATVPRLVSVSPEARFSQDAAQQVTADALPLQRLVDVEPVDEHFTRRPAGAELHEGDGPTVLPGPQHAIAGKMLAPTRHREGPFEVPSEVVRLELVAPGLDVGLDRQGGEGVCVSS